MTENSNKDGPWVEACALDSLSEGEVKRVDIQGVPIGLYRTADGVFALHDICTHAYAHLSEGWVEDEVVECPLHQAQFCIRTGKSLDDIAPEDAKTFPVRVEDGLVYLNTATLA